ncbi:C2 domain [Dillenia turbinata]|uniref:C2 domain n=1 Tax=Dillenia turbinata TaxID=194707 RepID=A0AAN8VJ06_9MAGN
MDSPQSVVSPFKASTVMTESEVHKSNHFVRISGSLTRVMEVQGKESAVSNLEGFIGVLEVFIHQARDIHNICIYQKQDVYAKLCLTSDPENTVSSKIIHGGGQHPVFNENHKLNVKTVDCSLKCEIWMLSRVKNYLGDQLLGFTLVPLTDILIVNGKLEKEFSLSSTDLFHSPAGFVQLSISYCGASPEVMAIPEMPTVSVTKNVDSQDSEVPECLPNDLNKIEFPDLKIANENHMMVSEYFGIPCSNLDSQSSESLVSSDNGSETAVDVLERLSASTATVDSTEINKHDSPPTSVSTSGSSATSRPASSQLSETPGVPKSPNEPVSPLKVKKADAADAESESSHVLSSPTSVKPIVTVNIEPEQKVVQQDIVDMYMKSMQQFTESLAKMKLPMDIEPGSTNSGNSSSDKKLDASKNPGGRVFYGSRAFF